VLGLACKCTTGAVAAPTVTVSDCFALPPSPVQVSIKVWSVLSGTVVCEPISALLPDQAPEAVQELALADDQLSAEVAPFVTVLGLALKLTVGADAVTETVADCDVLPPAPVQVSVKV
jgi:hypothetical protein